MNNINILLLGDEDWNDIYEIPEHVQVDYFSDIIEPIPIIYDLVILDRDISLAEYKNLVNCTRAYCLYATENVRMKNNTQKYYERKIGKRLYTGDVNAFMAETVNDYFPNPYGERMHPDYLTVNQMFEGEVEFNGNFDLRLKGDFGDDYTQILYWKNNLPIFEGQTLDLFLEHLKTENVKVKLRVIQFYNGSVGDVQQIWEYSDEELDEVIHVENHMAQGPIFVSVLAKGEGELRFISLHTRHSRHDIGFFLPGGDRTITSMKEEMFYYFDPGDLKPPLAVYFSGYRKQEGFEGYYMMRGLGCPFLLVTDPRLEGGAFYLGDKEFEDSIVRTIRGYMKRLQFQSNQLIFSGASMGTFGSLYYGCDLQPHALILGKPLANLGNVAKNERIGRVGIFPTSLDLLLKNYQGLGEEQIEQFNERFWEKFRKANWTHSKFIISYLYEDDYDKDAYPDILSNMRSEGVQIYGKGTHGRHNDNTQEVMNWFKGQYRKVLREDFGRKI